MLLRKNYSMYGLVIASTGTHILQIYWIYNDAIIDLTFRRKVRLKLQNEVQKVLYKLVLATEKNPLKFRIIQKLTNSNLSLRPIPLKPPGAKHCLAIL